MSNVQKRDTHARKRGRENSVTHDTHSMERRLSVEQDIVASFHVSLYNVSNAETGCENVAIAIAQKSETNRDTYNK